MPNSRVCLCVYVVTSTSITTLSMINLAWLLLWMCVCVCVFSLFSWSSLCACTQLCFYLSVFYSWSLFFYLLCCIVIFHHFCSTTIINNNKNNSSTSSSNKNATKCHWKHATIIIISWWPHTRMHTLTLNHTHHITHRHKISWFLWSMIVWSMIFIRKLNYLDVLGPRYRFVVFFFSHFLSNCIWQ